MKQTILVVSVALIALIGGVSARALVSSAETSQQITLPEFNLPDLSGKSHAMSQWQGKVRVINFWATWCPPCLKEMPEFTNLQNEFADKGLQFIGIALDEPDAVKEFIANAKINYPILIGGDQGTKIAHNLGNIVDTVPFTVVVNKAGKVVKSKMGELNKAELMEIVSPLLSAK